MKEFLTLMGLILFVAIVSPAIGILLSAIMLGLFVAIPLYIVYHYLTNSPNKRLERRFYFDLQS